MAEPHKPRLSRMERQPSPSVYAHEGESFGWAVSYSDVLMVLLSFFVIFFSYGKDETNSILQKIVLAAQPGDSAKFAGADDRAQSTLASTALDVRDHDGTSAATYGPSGPSASSGRELASLPNVEKLGLDSRVRQIVTNKSILLLLPNDAYAPASWKMRREAKQLFLTTLSRIKPFINDIDVTFIGYTDTQNVVHSRSPAVQNNFDLSSLRASNAVREAISQGFPAERVKATGAGQTGRADRTLSIQITLKGAL